MMKRIYSFVLILFFFSRLLAQQSELPNHAFYKPLITNPAFTGDADHINATLISRSRWINFKNAPQLNLFVLDGSLPNEKMGLGIDLFSDKKGISNKMGGNIYYSYRLQINENSKIRFGVALGMLDHTLNYSNAVIEDPTDPYLIGAGQKKTTINASAGLGFSWKTLDVGFSVPQLLGSTLEYQDNVSGRSYYKLDRHYQGSLKYKLMLSREKGISMIPLAQLYFLPNAPLLYNANLHFDWKEKFWIGGTYKSDYAVAVNAGVTLVKKISVGYSYDFIIGKIGTNAGMSHELMINFTFGKNKAEKQIVETPAADLSKTDSLEAELLAREQKIRADQDRIDKLDAELSKLKTQNEELQKNPGQAKNNATPSETTAVSSIGSSNDPATTSEQGIRISSPTANDFIYENKQPASKGFYVIAGAFLNTEFAGNELGKLKSGGYPDAQLIYSPSSLYTYVAATFHGTKEEAIKKIGTMKLNGAGDLWIISVK